MLRLFYRISDKGYPKAKLPGATKEVCLKNCLLAFPNGYFHVIADRCEDNTLEMLGNQVAVRALSNTDKGNAGSFAYALQVMLELCREDDIIYFVEDDYLHRLDAEKLLLEGIDHGDYVTLYDHPDKYTSFYGGGETSKVFKTPSSHWRYTISTCMTFAARVRTLRTDYNVWTKHLQGNHPNDHLIFSELRSQGQKLAVCIPGAACHTDLAFSGSVNSLLIEPWAIEQMVQTLSLKLEGEQPQWIEEMKGTLLTPDVQGWERLKRLDALTQALQKCHQASK